MDDLIAGTSNRLVAIAKRANIQLVAPLDALDLVPCEPPAAPPYGMRAGTWAEIASFVQDWANDGRRWVNIGLRVDQGRAFLCYEVPDRGSPGEPLAPGDLPALNVNGSPFESRDTRER
jgi:hypothetical protein